MTTGCVRASLEPEPGLSQDHSYQELTDGDAEGLSSELHHKDQLSLSSELHHEDHLKKPRRKDTPVLNTPPHIPGVRQMKAEKKTVYLEDQEKDVGH